jgi:hypothetical protein
VVGKLERQDRNGCVQIGKSGAKPRDPLFCLSGLLRQYFPALALRCNGMVGHAGKLGFQPSAFLWRLRHNTELSSNFVLTDYLERIWIRDGKVQQTEALCHETDLENRRLPRRFSRRWITRIGGSPRATGCDRLRRLN